MFNRARRSAGLILITFSLILCLIPVIGDRSEGTAFYHTGKRNDAGVQPVVTEHNGKLQVNTASAEELKNLPGIGDTLAERIVAERSQNGPFYYPEDLEAVRGIGPATLLGFRHLIDLERVESGE